VVATVALIGLLAFKVSLSRTYAVVLNVAVGFAAASILLTVAHTFRVVAATGLLIFWGLLLGLQLRTKISIFSERARSMAISALIWSVPTLVLAIVCLGATRGYTEIPWSSILSVAGGVLVASGAIGALEGAERAVPAETGPPVEIWAGLCEIKNGKMTERHLCEACARREILPAQKNTIEELLREFVEKHQKSPPEA
jgi:hypothetical protein